MVGGGFELVAKAINLGLRGTGREDAADGRVRTGHDLLDGRDVAIGEQRRGFFPELAVLILDAAQEQPTLDGDRDAERQHDRDRVHHETALLEEVEEGDEEIHVACPRWSSFANYGCRQLIIELREIGRASCRERVCQYV